MHPRLAVNFGDPNVVAAAIADADVVLVGRPFDVPAGMAATLRAEFDRFEKLETVEVWLRGRR